MTRLWLSLRSWIGTLLAFPTGAFLITLLKDPAIEVISVLFLLQTVVHIADSVVSLTCALPLYAATKKATASKSCGVQQRLLRSRISSSGIFRAVRSIDMYVQ